MLGRMEKLDVRETLNLPVEGLTSGHAASVAARSTWPVQDTMHVLSSAEAVRTGATAHHAATSLAGTITSHMGGILGVAAGTGISAYINHLVHGHQQKELLNRYRPQLASILGKEEGDLTVDDLQAVAGKNRSLSQELDRNRAMRNLRTGAALMGSAVAFGAVLLAASVPPLSLLGAAVAGSLFSWGGLGYVAACTAVSFAALTVFGKGAKKLGSKLLGHDVPTVEDHIHGIDELYKKGEHITPEHVMGVFVAANRRLQKDIKSAFGKRYDKLSPDKREQAMAMFGERLPLEQVTASINDGELNPRELIFAIHGQTSGLQSPAPERGHIPGEKEAAAPDKAQGQEPVLHDQAAVQTQAEAERDSQWRALLDKRRGEQQELAVQPAR